MATKTFGYTSKSYQFGGTYSTLPTKAMFLAKVGVGLGESIKIKASFGKTAASVLQYRTLLDVSNPSGTLVYAIDQRSTELDIAANIPSLLADWRVIIKAEIVADSETPDEYASTETAEYWVYKNSFTNKVFTLPYKAAEPLPDRSPEVIYPEGVFPERGPNYEFVSSPSFVIGPGGRIRPPRYDPMITVPKLISQAGVQVQFYAKNTNFILATKLTDIMVKLAHHFLQEVMMLE